MGRLRAEAARVHESLNRLLGESGAEAAPPPQSDGTPNLRRPAPRRGRGHPGTGVARRGDHEGALKRPAPDLRDEGDGRRALEADPAFGFVAATTATDVMETVEATGFQTSLTAAQLFAKLRSGKREAQTAQVLWHTG